MTRWYMPRHPTIIQDINSGMAAMATGSLSLPSMQNITDNTLAEAKQPLSLQEIAMRTGYAKSTVHRLLATLRTYDIIEQSPLDGRYLLGIHLFELGCSVSNKWDVTTVAKPYMQNIANKINEACDVETRIAKEQKVQGSLLRDATPASDMPPQPHYLTKPNGFA